MPDRITTGEGAVPPTFNALIRRGEGYGWIDGCGVTLTDSTTDIEVRVDGGRVRVASTYHDISETTVTLGDGDGQYPRRDLVGVDNTGSIEVYPGEPAQADPGDREGEFAMTPQPPAAASIDAVLLAEVWVPAGATSTGDLDAADHLTDRRVSDVGGQGTIPVTSSRPSAEDLTDAEWWLNTNAGQFEAYRPDIDEIITFSTSSVQSFSGTARQTIEDFQNDITANWETTESLTYNSPAFENGAAAYWDGTWNATAWSLPGDGLDYYAEPGDTITLAVYGDGGNRLDLGFAKDTDATTGEYRVQAVLAQDEFRLVETDDGSIVQTLGSTSVTLSQQTWYWLEVDYDGGGEGVHPTRLYSTDTSTDPGTKDTELAAISSPTADTTRRGRGYLTSMKGTGRWDYLTVEN